MRRKAIYIEMEREMLCKHTFAGLCRDSGLLFSHSVVSNTATSWTAACQASLSFTISQSFLKLMSIESMMPSNHLILGLPLLLLPSVFPRIRVFFLVSQFFASGGQSIGASASASVLPINIQS